MKFGGRGRSVKRKLLDGNRKYICYFGFGKFKVGGLIGFG